MEIDLSSTGQVGATTNGADPNDPNQTTPPVGQTKRALWYRIVAGIVYFIAGVFLWFGFWNILEVYFLPHNFLAQNLVSIGIGLLLVIGMAILSYYV